MKSKLPVGFTLVELLVVIAIIAIMVLLLLPAINAMRESARRTQCINKVAQLIVAVHSHEAMHGYYPSGVRDPSQSPIVSQEQGFHHGWIIQLLPHLEERNLYRAINLEKSVYDKSNLPARETQPHVIICPSYAGNRGKIAISNYAAVHHDVEAPIDHDNHGVFFLNSRVSRDEVTDGSQYTLFIGERVDEPRNVLGWMSGTRDTLRNTGTPLNRTGVAPPVPRSLSDELLEGDASQAEIEHELAVNEVDAEITEESLNSQSVVREGSERAQTEADGENQAEGDDGAQQDAEGNPVGPVDIWADAKAQGLYVGGFGSDHLGGAVFAFGDGHVTFIADDINQAVYQQMGHRADGQLVDIEAIGR